MTSGQPSVLRAHRLFLALLLAGTILRLITVLAYQPALLYIDAYRYLDRMSPVDPTSPSPVGYMLFLRPILAVGDLWLVPLVHHLLGLGMAVAIYALGLRAGARRWLAALAAAPVLLDAYQLQIEQNVLSETLFQALALAGLALLVWRGAASPAVVAGSGLLLGFAAIVRLIGQVLIIPVTVYLLLVGGERVARRAVVAGLFWMAFLIPLLAHMAYYQSWTGTFALTPVRGQMAYARVAPWVDCDRLELPAHQRSLCPREPLGQRLTIDQYMWNRESPVFQLVPPGVDHQQVLGDFARRAILAQPLDFLGAVGRDMLKNFAWTKFQAPEDVDVGRWHFKLSYPRYGPVEDVIDEFGGSGPSVRTPLAWFLRSYQLSVGYVPGTLLGLALVAGLAGVFAGGGVPRSLRAQCLLWTASGAVLVLAPSVYEFSWRYMLPGLVLIPLAGALGLTALVQRARASLSVGALDDVDRAAIAAFREAYGDPDLGPLAVVIAAYNEEEALGAVLLAMPSRVLGQRVSTIVVDDGSADGTASVARAAGAHTVVTATNRGQGAALRVGYRVARDGGARYIATLDADGQYDPRELATVLEPILLGDADFVTGSRRLGREETTDRLRRLGVRVFAWLVSRLTGQHITDTSNGLRAMKASVTATVTLTQPQYQASELLIGTLAQGYRVAEKPTTMRERSAGVSKKGRNLLYGLRFGRVVLSTWLRERARGGRMTPVPTGGPGRRAGQAVRTSR